MTNSVTLIAMLVAHVTELDHALIVAAIHQ